MRRVYQAKKYLYILVFFILSLLIMGNLLKAGYIFALDMAWGPSLPNEQVQFSFYGIGTNLMSVGASPTARVLYAGMVYLLSYLLPVWLIQKAILVALLALSGIAMYRLAPTRNTCGRYFAGLLYMVNPFTYIRLVAGHLFPLLWGYAFLPLVVKSFIDLFNRPNTRNVLKAGIWLTLIAPSEHLLTMAFGILGAFLIVNLTRGDRAKILGSFLGTVAVFALLNIGWIYSIVLREASAVQSVSQVTSTDLELFATSKGSNGVLNVAAMYGFWRVGYDYPKEHLWGWQLLYFIILFLAIYGLVQGFKGRHGLYVKSMGLIAIASLLLAVGVSSPLFPELFYFLYEKFPLMGGFRDQQKFVALLVLAYAYLGSIGVAALEERWLRPLRAKGNIFHIVPLVLLLLLPITYSYTMFFGLGGQVRNTDYPSDYYKAKAYLDEGEFSILFLPWHNYMHFGWIGSRVANPADNFFLNRAFRGDNIEMPGLYTQSQNPISQYIESLIANKDRIDNLGEFIAPLNVSYVVLAKEVDYEEYSFLFRQADLKMVEDTPNLLVFKNTHPASYSPEKIREQARLLGWSEAEGRRLEKAILTNGLRKQRGRYLPGYVVSAVSFLCALAYFRRRREYLDDAYEREGQE